MFLTELLQRHFLTQQMKAAIDPAGDSAFTLQGLGREDGSCVEDIFPVNQRSMAIRIILCALQIIAMPALAWDRSRH